MERLAEYYDTSPSNIKSKTHRSGGSIALDALRLSWQPYQKMTPGFDEWIMSYCHSPVSKSVIDIGEGRREYFDQTCGTICVIPPGAQVECASDSDVDLTVISVPRSRVELLLEGSGINPHLHLAPLVGKISIKHGVGALFDTIWGASARGGPSGNLTVDAAFLQLVSILADAFEDTDTQRSLNNPDQFARVVEYVENSLDRAITVMDLAQIQGMSASHFSRRFKAAFGEPVWSYVKRRRCERAIQALRTTGDPISKIAFDYGFANQSHMTTSIRKAYRTTPKAIRNEIRVE